MSGKKAIVSASWRVSGLTGCCGAGVLSRVAGNYISRKTIESHRKAYEQHCKTPYLDYSYTCRMRERGDSMRAFLTRRKPTIHAMGMHTYVDTYKSSYFHPIGLEVEDVWWAILEEMQHMTKYSMYMCADNMSRDGDVHTGPASTKNFMRWITDNGLGVITTAGPVTSLRTGAPLQGWIFHPNWEVIYGPLKEHRVDFWDRIKELNNVPSIKETIQQQQHERGRAGAELVDVLDGSWDA